MTKRVAIGMMSHETNVFSPVQTPLQAWKDRSFAIGQEILDHYAGTKSSIGAFLEVGQQNGWEMIPTLCASAVPSAPTDAQTYAYLKDSLIFPMVQAKPDAVLLALHGAMQAEGVDDPEGDIIMTIKQQVGDIPVLVVLDLHGNITANMSANCDAVFAFDTNPHVDAYERGVEAARCLEKLFAGQVNPVNAYTHPPMMPPTINMRTAEGPMVELKELGRQWEAHPGIINVSIFGGFPFGDISHCGLSVVTTADGDPSLAQQCSDAIAARAWEIRNQFLKSILQPCEALDQAMAMLDDHDHRPIILADVADNPGGGGSGDTPELLREMLKRDIAGSAAAAIWDPETVQQAIKVGVGGKAIFRIGGKAEPAYGEPLVVDGTVRVLSDGLFAARGPMGRGMQWNMGLSTVIEVGHTKLVVCSIRIACNDADLFRSVGIDPADASMLLIKSRGHFRASFEPLARAIIEVDAPGAANPNLERYQYKFVNRPLWPLDR